MIDAFQSSIVPTSSCYLSGPLLYRSPVVVFFDRGHPRFRKRLSPPPIISSDYIVRQTIKHFIIIVSTTKKYFSSGVL